MTTFSQRLEQFLKPLAGEPVGPQVRILIQTTLDEVTKDPTAYGRAEIQAIAARTFQLWDSVPAMVRQTTLLMGSLREADLELRKAGWYLQTLPLAVPTAAQATNPDWSPYRGEHWDQIRKHALVGLLPQTIETLIGLARGHNTLILRSVPPAPPENLRSIITTYPSTQWAEVCRTTGLTPARVTPWILESLLSARDHLVTVGRRFLLMKSFRLYEPLGLAQFDDYAVHCDLTLAQAEALIRLYRGLHSWAELIGASLTSVEAHP